MRGANSLKTAIASLVIVGGNTAQEDGERLPVPDLMALANGDPIDKNRPIFHVPFIPLVWCQSANLALNGVVLLADSGEIGLLQAYDHRFKLAPYMPRLSGQVEGLRLPMLQAAELGQRLRR